MWLFFEDLHVCSFCNMLFCDLFQLLLFVFSGGGGGGGSMVVPPQLVAIYIATDVHS